MIIVEIAVDCIDPLDLVGTQVHVSKPTVTTTDTGERPNGHYEVALRGPLSDVHYVLADVWGMDHQDALEFIDNYAEVM